jgi:hypothetical protein
MTNPSEALRFEGRFLHAARIWGRALALERAIEKRDADQLVHMVGYDHYCVLAVSNNRLATASAANGVRSVLAFTAPDAAARTLETMAEPRPKIATFAGRALFPLVVAMDVDGVLLNPFGPGPMAFFPTEVCGAMAELAEAIGGRGVSGLC